MGNLPSLCSRNAVLKSDLLCNNKIVTNDIEYDDDGGG